MPMSDRAMRLAYSKAYYRKNRDRMLAEQKDRDQRTSPATKAAYQEAYRLANRDALLAKQRARNKAKYEANKPVHKARNKRQALKAYGLTQESLNAILERQEHQCPICERFLAYPTVRAIDHCHVTGSVRGVLCRRCNTALGLLEDSPATLERAMEYLSMPRLQAFHSWLSGVISTLNKTP